MKDIVFDESSVVWTNSRSYDLAFVRTSMFYLNDLIRARGYLYLNDIYEQFGLVWNPDDENTCYRRELIFDLLTLDDKIVIHLS